jgi:hypothetical protein
MRAIFLPLLTLVLLPACAQTPVVPEVAQPSAFQAPTTYMIATREKPIEASHVLAGAEADYFTVRAEKVAYGPQPLGGVTSFTTYTYDAQRISTFSGSGYRYRWIYQSGVSVPVTP